VTMHRKQQLSGRVARLIRRKQTRIPPMVAAASLRLGAPGTCVGVKRGISSRSIVPLTCGSYRNSAAKTAE
jgi:hypothetical protein